MLQNLKVDMVYYKTNTDFEMEFNLCGCCRMRLLNDKVSDPKTFLNSLARAVSRSRIIMTVGPVKGDGSIMKLVASALSMEVTPADLEAYGIKEEEEILILEGSTPLVTPSGEFGGCIIESGPQSMILLTQDKDIRKKIMNTLVHPYVEELSKQDSGETAEPIAKQIKDNTLRTVETVKEMIAPKKDETGSEDIIIPTEEEPKAQESAKDDRPVIETEAPSIITETAPTLKETPKAPKNPVEDLLFTETNDSDTIPFHRFKPARSNNRWANEVNSPENTPDIDNDDFEEIYSSAKRSSKKSPLNAVMLIFFIVLLISIALLCYCVFYVPAKDGVTAGAYIRDIFEILFG